MTARSQALNPRQQLFVEAYCSSSNFNASDAYVQAGYGGRNKSKAAELLKVPKIAKAIEARLETRKATFWVREDDVLRGIYEEPTNKDPGSTQTGRIQAWVWLGKHLGMFQEKKKEDAPVTYNIINYNSHNPKIEEETKRAIQSLSEEEIHLIEDIEELDETD